jgi:hypothetical protein
MLLALIVSLAAQAAELPSLSLDLDSDGRADSVRILEGDPESTYQVLEVALTASGKTFRYEKLIGRLYEELSDSQRKEGSPCSSLQERSLELGPKGSFFLKEVGGSYDACAGEWRRSLEVRLIRDQLAVTKLVASTKSWSMGDPSPYQTLTFDFSRGVLSGVASDHHSDGDKPEKGSVALKCGAQPLAGYQQEHFSACAKSAAKKLRKKITIDCGRAYDSFSCPVQWQ